MGGRGPKRVSTRTRARRAKDAMIEKIAQLKARLRSTEQERDDAVRKLSTSGFHYEKGA